MQIAASLERYTERELRTVAAENPKNFLTGLIEGTLVIKTGSLRENTKVHKKYKNFVVIKKATGINTTVRIGGTCPMSSLGLRLSFVFFPSQSAAVDCCFSGLRAHGFGYQASC